MINDKRTNINYARKTNKPIGLVGVIFLLFDHVGKQLQITKYSKIVFELLILLIKCENSKIHRQIES